MVIYKLEVFEMGETVGTDWTLILLFVLIISLAIIGSKVNRIKGWSSKKPFRRHVILTPILLAVFGVMIYFFLTRTPSQNRTLQLYFIGIFFIISLLITTVFLKVKLKSALKSLWVIILAIISIPAGLLALSYSNEILDSSAPQTFLGTVENRRWDTTRIPGIRNSGGVAHFIYLTMNDNDEVMRLNINRRLYNSISVGDMVYICKKPGFWGIEWNSCLHRLVQPTDMENFNTVFARRAANHQENQELQIHPDDDAEHIRVLLQKLNEERLSVQE
jgi:membrane protein CcdC involved in cytochrome C biogenesis